MLDIVWVGVESVLWRPGGGDIGGRYGCGRETHIVLPDQGWGGNQNTKSRVPQILFIFYILFFVYAFIIGKG